MEAPLVSIGIIDQPLKLLRIPKRHVPTAMVAIVGTLLFQNMTGSQHFYSISLNDIELSIFGEARLIEATHAAIPAAEAELSDTTWIALQVEQHSEDFEDAGIRVREISAPLAAQGISILFQSTYISDFILLKQRRLGQGIEILQKTAGFVFHSDSNRPTPENTPSLSPVAQMRASTSTSEDPSPILAKSITGSLTLNEEDLNPATAIFTRRKASDGSSTRGSPRLSALSLSREPSLPLPHLPPSATSESLISSLNLDDSPGPTFHPRSFEAGTASMTSSLHSDVTMELASKLSLLPDELICIGLNLDYAHIWREKLIRAFFYSDWVLPRPPALTTQDPFLSGEQRDRSLVTALAEEANESPISTASSSHPVPFVSFTSTSEGCSLTADIRLLRKLFSPEETDLYHTAGGSLDDAFYGEGSILNSTVNSPVRGRSRDRKEYEEDWTHLDEEDVDAGRKLMKCLRLDLTSFGLDKTGIVGRVTERLTLEGINLLYCSTFACANILVAKSDLLKARIALEGNLKL